MKILITGSNGYIGSCLRETLEKKFDLINIDKKKHIFSKKNFINLNLNSPKKIIKKLENQNIETIIHLAGESTIDNIENKNSYFENNVSATKNLIKISNKLGINKIIFSSTAAVYQGNSKLLSEKSKLKPNNIYGSTKLTCEKIIKKEFSKKNKSYIIFRFFNVCGSIIEKKIGEIHQPETHLIPILVSKMISGNIFNIYGSNYQTKDGTCIRDYIHIKDLLSAYHKAIKLMKKSNVKETFNLGTGKGFSVLDIVSSSNKIIKKSKLKVNFIKKRKGDLPRLVCSGKKAENILKWKIKNSNIKKILSDELKWQKFLEKKKIKINPIY